MFKDFRERPISHFNERGISLLALLVAFVFIGIIASSIVSKYNNMTIINDRLTVTQNNQMRSNLVTYSTIAREIAKTLDIDQTVTVSVDSPNYFSADGKKYINLFNDFKVDASDLAIEPISHPLYLTNNLKSQANLVISRTDLNLYTCVVEITYYDYSTFSVKQIPINDALVKTLTGDEYINHAVGNQHLYTYTIKDSIVPTTLKPQAEQEVE